MLIAGEIISEQTFQAKYQNLQGKPSRKFCVGCGGPAKVANMADIEASLICESKRFTVTICEQQGQKTFLPIVG
jgi:hypothetical protein